MLSFEELTEARRSLQTFCLLHVPSLLKLQSGISFKLFPDEPDLDPELARHTTATATCYSSLFDCPPRFQTSGFGQVDGLARRFARQALLREWKSEKSAGVYCRCRALPMVIRWLDSYHESIDNHLAVILGQLDQHPERFGIGEADPQAPEKDWYPPNAFHTYWALEVFDALTAKFPADYKRLLDLPGLDLKRRHDGMLLWARQQLGSQLGLHSASPRSSMLDSDQLGWSLAIFFRFDENLKVNLESRDLIKQAFNCLFSTQTDGTWRHYKPIFHYMQAGNAYCYVFETFAALLQSTLRDNEKGEMLRELLKPYCKHLMDLWKYADSTKIPLSSSTKEIGWCSGHRTNVTSPESWASASVFSYAQAVRRLIGIWCREEARAAFKTPRSSQTSVQAAEKIVSRGDSWGNKKTSVSERLWTSFVNPQLMHDCTDKLEPDSRPIDERHARSAILFGPPGTSKTTLIRSLADLINWDYVELHASHFVAEGLGQVQKTADTIFKQLSQLDHAVVLFDEIDELVRERDIEKDAFGRFLTTSMLPKLAQLWEERKILYFVATNHINYFDSAIIRSQRFDALILVSPPSFDAKVRELTKQLSEIYGVGTIGFQVTEDEIDKELQEFSTSESSGGSFLYRFLASLTKPGADWEEQELKPELGLAKFALLRWDELYELAFHLAEILGTQNPVPGAISQEILRAALLRIADTQWRRNKSYSDYLRDSHSERRDYQMVNVWEVRGEDLPAALGVESRNGLRWLSKRVDSVRKIETPPGFELVPKGPGCVEIRRTTQEGNAGDRSTA